MFIHALLVSYNSICSIPYMNYTTWGYKIFNIPNLNTPITPRHQPFDGGFVRHIYRPYPLGLKPLPCLHDMARGRGANGLLVTGGHCLAAGETLFG